MRTEPMKNYPKDFSAVVASDCVILTWTDADGQSLTAKLTGPEALDLGDDLSRKAKDAIREGQRLRSLAADQLRSSTGVRIGTGGRRAA